MFTIIDYIAIVLYVLLLFGIGYITSRRQTAEGFLISDRKLSFLSAAATINASKTGSIILIFTVGIYDYGLSAVWYFIAAIIGYFTFIPFAKYLHRFSDHRFYTLAQYFQQRFGPVAGGVATISTIALQVGFLAVNLIACAKVLSFFTQLDYALSAVLIALIVLVYLMLAGFSAVVRTDVFQYLAIVFILIAFLFPLASGTTIPQEDWNLFSTGAGNIVAFALWGILIPFAQPELWQRVYAMPNTRRVKQAFLASIACFIPVIIGLTGLALLIKAKLPDMDPDIALIYGLAHLLPVGMSGLAVVVFFACFMSSIDTYAYTAASSIVQDVLKLKDKEKAVQKIRMVIVPLLLVATVVAVTTQDLLETSFIVAGFYIVVAIPAIASFVKKTIRPITVTTSMVLSTIFLVGFVIMDFLQDSLEPTLVTKVLIVSVLGLFVGGFVSSWKERRVG